MSIQQNLKSILNTLPKEVTLVAVSKTKSNAEILEAYDAGQKIFGENYVQELIDKFEQLPKDIKWHFIGHLQSNKVKYIVPFVDLIHGIDSFKLLKEVNKQAQKNKKKVKCLLQIHIATEETKFGLSFDECLQILNSTEYKSLEWIEICGLMSMASNTSDEVQIRNEFSSLKKFLIELKPKFPELKILSFGMSSDYKIAIEEGSTMVRIGSSIFGERNYTL